jgi:DHA2 family multidrug resistance protein-like MFS transporter
VAVRTEPRAEPVPKTAPVTDGLPLAQRRRAYLALGAATAMAVLDGTIANTALPTIARELHVTPAESVWVINAFQVAVTMSLFAIAALGQARGLSRIYRYGIAIFTAGSLCCALAPSLIALVLARFLQGLGAAALMAIAPALLRHIFPRAQLGRAVGINGIVIGGSIAAGPTIGGLILAFAPWQWLFLLNVPIGIGIVLLARGALPRDHGHGGAIDVPSIGASALGFGLLIYGVDGFARGDRPLLVLAELATGFAAFAWFMRRQTRLAQPMFAVELFGRPLFSLAATTSLLGFTAWGLAFVSLPFLFQIELGASPLESGLLLSAWPATMAVLAPLVGRLSDRYPASVLSTVGLVVYLAGLVLYALLPAHPTRLDLVLRALVCGIGCGLYQSPNSRELMGSAPRALAGSASAMLAAARVSGQSFGAALAAIAFATLSLQSHAALWGAAIFALLATASSVVRLRFPRSSYPSGAP